MMQATAYLPMPDVRQRDILTEAAHDRLVAAADPAPPIRFSAMARAVRTTLQAASAALRANARSARPALAADHAVRG
jgi:hypothetical protein